MRKTRNDGGLQRDARHLPVEDRVHLVEHGVLELHLLVAPSAGPMGDALRATPPAEMRADLGARPAERIAGLATSRPVAMWAPPVRMGGSAGRARVRAPVS